MINFSGECGCKLSNIPILAFLYHAHQCLFQLKEHTSRVFVSHVQSPPGFFVRPLWSYILMLLHQLPLFLQKLDRDTLGVSLCSNQPPRIWWSNGSGSVSRWPRRHILCSGQTWQRLHAAHELILGWDPVRTQNNQLPKYKRYLPVNVYETMEHHHVFTGKPHERNYKWPCHIFQLANCWHNQSGYCRIFPLLEFKQQGPARPDRPERNANMEIWSWGEPDTEGFTFWLGKFTNKIDWAMFSSAIV